MAGGEELAGVTRLRSMAHSFSNPKELGERGGDSEHVPALCAVVERLARLVPWSAAMDLIGACD